VRVKEQASGGEKRRAKELNKEKEDKKNGCSFSRYSEACGISPRRHRAVVFISGIHVGIRCENAEGLSDPRLSAPGRGPARHAACLARPESNLEADIE
jgi:hypothetical protein